MFRKTLLAGALATAAMSVHASVTVSIDPDGLGATHASTPIDGLDIAPSSVLVTSTPGGNAVAPVVGAVLQTYTHGTIQAFSGSTGPIAFSGLNSPGAGGFEWTFVAGFREVVSSVGATSVALDAAAGGDNFFRLYHSGFNSNTLAGTGYADGTLIMSGTIVPYDPTDGRGRTTFTVDPTAPPQPLDQFGANNYPGVASTVGSGSGTFDLVVNSFDSNYFTGFSIGQVINVLLDTQTNAPFTQVNPSALFTTGSGATTPGVASVGPINGLTGPNFMLQTDGTATFQTTQIPEPASLALAALALAGLGVGRRRRTRD